MTVVTVVLVLVALAGWGWWFVRAVMDLRDEYPTLPHDPEPEPPRIIPRRPVYDQDRHDG